MLLKDLRVVVLSKQTFELIRETLEMDGRAINFEPTLREQVARAAFDFEDGEITEDVESLLLAYQRSGYGIGEYVSDLANSLGLTDFTLSPPALTEEEFAHLVEVAHSYGVTVEKIAGWIGWDHDRYSGLTVPEILRKAIDEGDDPEWLEDMCLNHGDMSLVPETQGDAV